MTDTPDDTFWTELTNETPSQRVLLLYGPSGSGKTYLAGQLPRVLFLACDPGVLGGSESAKRFGIKHVKIKSYAHFMRILPEIQKEAGISYDTVVVDSISYLSQMIMAAILETVGREIPRFEEWNLNATRTRKIIKLISDLNCNVCFIAIDAMSKDETTGKLYGGPSLPGKLAVELPQACDVVLRLFTTTKHDQNGKLIVSYRYRAVPDSVWFAKDRTGLLSPEGEASYDALSPLFTKE